MLECSSRRKLFALISDVPVSVFDQVHVIVSKHLEAKLSREGLVPDPSEDVGFAKLCMAGHADSLPWCTEICPN